MSIPPTRTAFAFDPIEDAIAAFARGEFLVVMDDEGRENEGDLIVAGSALSTQKMAWMIKHTRYVRPCLSSFLIFVEYVPSAYLAGLCGLGRDGREGIQ